MKKIICYGDSNTFGFNAKDGSIFDENTRWTSLLQKNLGSEYEVVNEGMYDRTGFVDNPRGDLFSGPKHFPEMLAKTDNIDLLILAIGTNDLQSQYNISFDTIENGLKNLIHLAKTKAKNIIIIPPVILDERILKGAFNTQFDETGVEKSKKVGQIYRKIADKNGCLWFDINEFTAPSNYDGLHYDENSHRLIAEKLAEFIKKEKG